MAMSESEQFGLLDQLAEDFAIRFRRGEHPALEEYASRYPELAHNIREFFPAMIEVEQVDCLGRDGTRERRPVAPRLKEIGDYRIIREIGHGGMGVVFEAEQVSLGRRVALKVLPRHVVGDSKVLERFRREAKAAARLHHTNIVPVFEVGQEADTAFYAMQFIQGQGLDQVIDELARFRAPSVKSPGGDSFKPGLPPTSPIVFPGAAADRPGEQKLGHVADSLLKGRLAIGMLESAQSPGSDVTEAAMKDSLSSPTFAAGAESRSTGRSRTTGTAHPAGAFGSAVLPGGTTLSLVGSSVRKQPFFRSVAQICRQAAQGLAYAHSRGVVHRDIKPSNLLLDTAGVVWITDFGLAKAEDDGLTATGDILGTIRYMAPERFRGEGDARADIYALGLTLYELLTLRPAFDSSDRLRLIERIKAAEPARPRSLDASIARDLETIVLKAINKDPRGRYATADAMADDLQRFLEDEPIQARRTTAAERYARWARHHPGIAILGAALTATLVLATVASLVAAGIFARQADRERSLAGAERSARQEASRRAEAEFQARTEAVQAKVAADKARAAAQAETYRATLSEVKALRAGHQLGWRDEALADLKRLVVMPTPRRDLVELRSEAVASIGELGVKEVARFEASGDTVSKLDFSPDSRTLVTSSNNGDLNFWDVPDRKHLRRLAGIGRGSYRGDIVFLPDGELAYITANNRVAFLTASGRQSARRPFERENSGAAKIAIDRGGATLAVGWEDGRIDLFAAVTGALQRSFTKWAPREFALSPDGRRLAVQSADGSIQVLPANGQGPAIALADRVDRFSSLAFCPDGSTLAGVVNRSLALWDLASKTELMRLGGHKESITSVDFSPDGDLVATSCGDHITRIWDARDSRPLAVLPGPWYMRGLAFSPDGRYLAASADPGPVCLYELKGRREQRRLVGHNFGAQRLAFHPRLSRFASGADDHAIIVWDASEGHLLRRWAAHGSWVTGLAYSPDGSLLASACGSSSSSPSGSSNDHSIHLWDAENGTLRKRLPHPPHWGIRTLAFDPAGRRLASGDEGGTVLLWDLESSQIFRRENLSGTDVTSVNFVDDGRRLVISHLSGTVALLDLESSGKDRRVELPHGCARLVVDMSGNRVVVGDPQGGLSTLTLPDLSVVHRLPAAHDGKILSLALSPDSRLLATSGIDLQVVLRDAQTFVALVDLSILDRTR